MDKSPLDFGTAFAVYTRVSTPGQDDNTSQEQQLRECKSFGENKGWMFVEHLHDTKTGKSYKARVDIMKLLKLVESRRVKHVVFYKVDRTARELSVFKALVNDIYSNGGIVSIVNKDKTYKTAAECYRENFLDSVFAEWELTTIKDRMRGGLSEQFNKGSVIKPLYLGYNSESIVVNGSKFKRPTINQEQAETIQLIFSTYIETKSIKSTLMAANGAGKLSRRGNAFNFKTIKDILEAADSYAGLPEVQYFDKAQTIKREFTYPAIITQQQAATAKMLLATGIKKRVDRKDKPFDRLVTCSCCGKTAQTYKHAANKGHHVNYDGGYRIQCASFLNAVQQNYKGQGIANWNAVESKCRHQFKEGIFIGALDDYISGIDAENIENRYFKDIANIIAKYREAIEAVDFNTFLRDEIEAKRRTFNDNMAKLMSVKGIDIAAFANNVNVQLQEWDSELEALSTKREALEAEVKEMTNSLRYFGIRNPEELAENMEGVTVTDAGFFEGVIPVIVRATSSRVIGDLHSLKAALGAKDWGTVNGLMQRLGLRFSADFSEPNVEERRKGVKVTVTYTAAGAGAGVIEGEAVQTLVTTFEAEVTNLDTSPNTGKTYASTANNEWTAYLQFWYLRQLAQQSSPA